MVVTYVYHSCCVLEFDDFSLIIDYYKDTTDNKTEEKGWVNQYLLKKDNPLYVLCTHSHADHLNKDVFSWSENKDDITYIFSSEIRGKLKEGKQNISINYLDKLQSYKDDNITVTAFGSTDIGGSFLIEYNNKKIFHAGDLNNWHWNEEVPEQEALDYENLYIRELELLAQEVDHLDIAMFPLDSRLGKDFLKGGIQFINKIDTSYFLPLHFGDNYSKLEEFERYANAANCKLLKLEEKGQSFNI